MQTNISDEILGLKFKYFINDCMAKNSIGSKKEWEEFANREKLQAENFLKASEDAGVKRIIYLGGLVTESLDLSNLLLTLFPFRKSLILIMR